MKDMTKNQIADQINQAELKYKKHFHDYITTIVPLLKEAKEAYQSDYADWVKQSLPFTKRQANRLVIDRCPGSSLGLPQIGAQEIAMALSQYEKNFFNAPPLPSKPAISTPQIKVQGAISC